MSLPNNVTVISLVSLKSPYLFLLSRDRICVGDYVRHGFRSKKKKKSKVNVLGYVNLTVKLNKK